MIRKSLLFLIFFSCSFSFAYAQKELTIEQIFGKGVFREKGIDGLQWIDGGQRFSFKRANKTTDRDDILLYDCSTGMQDTLIKGSDLKLSARDSALKWSDYSWSPDEKHILFVGEAPKAQYLSRKNPSGNFYLYNLASRTLRVLTNVAEPMYHQKFSPDGRYLGYVKNNNIYLLEIATGKIVAVTKDGSENILNGRGDWVYEEELGIADAWRWSPDGSSIVFWRFDQKRVPEFNMFDLNTLRIDQMKMKYPKAGDVNSTVKVGVYHRKNRRTVWVNLGKETDIYVARVQWTNNQNTLSIILLNRLQNKAELFFVNAKTGRSRLVLTEEEKTWVELEDRINFLKSANQFFWISERDGYRHIYLYTKESKLIRQVTKGSWDVESIIGIDEASPTIYFMAAKDSPLEKHLFSVRFDGSDLKQLTQTGSTFSINMVPDNKKFIATYSGVQHPKKIALYAIDGTLVRMVEENNFDASQYRLGTTEFFTFKTSDGVELNGSMIKPADFDPAKKYRVLVNVYGGPGSQTVTNQWGAKNGLWYQMLAKEGVITVSVDGRGTGARGKAFKSIVYKNLGKWEVNDQIEAAKYLASLPYVDKEHIGIWGWSYGGYMAASTILRGADYFHMAIAVAPVTDWRFYDDIYTERYMQRPIDNPEGYRQSAAMTYAGNLKGNLLIVHGTTDDNVHWQNSAQLVDALQKAGKQFQTMFYVNKNHGIRGGNTTQHLYTMMTEYILKNL